MTQFFRAARCRRPPAAPDHAGRRERRGAGRAARSRAVLRARARRPARPRPEPLRTHHRELVLRAQHAHARVVRARRASTRRGCREPGHAVLVSREGRDGARHDLHAAGDARRHPRDARRRARPASVRRAVRRTARLHPECRRSAFVAPDAGAARCVDRAAGERGLRTAARADRRRYQPLARRTLGLASVQDVGRRRAADRGPRRLDARPDRIRRRYALQRHRPRASPVSTS